MDPNYIKTKIKSRLASHLELNIPVLSDQVNLQTLLQYPNGSIAVTYAGSSYKNEAVQNEIFQTRNATFIVSLFYRALIQLDSTIPVIENIKSLLRGLPLDEIPNRLIPLSDELKPYNEKEGILNHEITFSAQWSESQTISE